MKCRQPRKFRQGDIRLAMLPCGARFMCKVAEVLSVWRKIGSPRKDATAEPGPGFISARSEIPPPHMRPVTRSPTKHSHHRRLSCWNAVHTRRDRLCHARSTFDSGSVMNSTEHPEGPPRPNDDGDRTEDEGNAKELEQPAS